MGLRGELFSSRLSCDGRTYFFNVKENRSGDLYLTVVESKATETGDFDRRSIIIFQDNMEEFLKALNKSRTAMDEAAPSIRSKPPRTRREAMEPRDDGREDSSRLAKDEMPRHFINTGKDRKNMPATADRTRSGKTAFNRADSFSRPEGGTRARFERTEKQEAHKSGEVKKTGKVIRVKKKTDMLPAVKNDQSDKIPGTKKVKVKRDK